MRVAHVSFHGCIRAHKMAWELQGRGFPQFFVTHGMSVCHSFNGYEGVFLYDPAPVGDDPTPNPRQLRNHIEILNSQVGLFHVHNEPNWIYRVVRDVATKPVIWDIHDWTSLRRADAVYPQEVEDEKYALETADAFVVPSQGYLRRLRAQTSKPAAIVRSCVPAFLYPQKTQDRPGLAYEGGVKGSNNLEYNYPYRNWAEFAQKAVASFTNGDKMFFYTANTGEVFDRYAHDKIVMNAPLTFDQLLVNLATHSAGLVGSPYPLLDFEDAMPNKVFEYVAAGIPCIVVNAPEARRFVEENGLGVGIDDPTQVPEALNECKSLQVHRDRWGYTMDGEIPKLLELYREVLVCKRRRISQLDPSMMPALSQAVGPPDVSAA